MYIYSISMTTSVSISVSARDDDIGILMIWNLRFWEIHKRSKVDHWRSSCIELFFFHLFSICLSNVRILDMSKIRVYRSYDLMRSSHSKLRWILMVNINQVTIDPYRISWIWFISSNEERHEVIHTITILIAFRMKLYISLMIHWKRNYIS